MRNVIWSISVFLLFTVSVSLSTAFAEDSLDGKTSLVTLSEQDKDGETTPDELIFKEGTFFSADCEQYGFSPAPYEASKEVDKTMFESTLVSEKEGKADWKGTVEGGKISGAFLWSKEGQEPIKYNFEGSLKK